MRILLVGNYPLDQQQSMSRYAELLKRELSARHVVCVISPKPLIGLLPGNATMRKWLGYVDKFIIFPFSLRRQAKQFDLVHVCDHSAAMYLKHVARKPRSVTCHDLLAIRAALGHFPEQTISRTGRFYQKWILASLATAQNVVCVSRKTAADLDLLAPNKDREIVVIHNPLNSQFDPASDARVTALRRRLGLAPGEKFVFHIGGNQWYKNREGVIHIFQNLLAILKRAGGPKLRLVMAGKPFSQKMRQLVSGAGLEDAIVELTDVSHEDLVDLYSTALLLLFPSLYEGFGWPVLEAQSCGCVVVTSARAPLTEIGGDGALFIDPANHVEAAQTIFASLDQLEELRALGFANARRFDVAAAISAYETFLADVRNRAAHN